MKRWLTRILIASAVCSLCMMFGANLLIRGVDQVDESEAVQGPGGVTREAESMSPEEPVAPVVSESVDESGGDNGQIAADQARAAEETWTVNRWADGTGKLLQRTSQGGVETFVGWLDSLID